MGLLQCCPALSNGNLCGGPDPLTGKAYQLQLIQKEDGPEVFSEDAKASSVRRFQRRHRSSLRQAKGVVPVRMQRSDRSLLRMSCPMLLKPEDRKVEPRVEVLKMKKAPSEGEEVKRFLSSKEADCPRVEPVLDPASLSAPRASLEMRRPFEDKYEEVCTFFQESNGVVKKVRDRRSGEFRALKIISKAGYQTLSNYQEEVNVLKAIVSDFHSLWS